VGFVTNSNPLGLDPNDPAGKDDIVTSGELHVPVNRPVIAELSSKDVIHDYFVPEMRIGGDAIPGSLIPIWFTPIKTGSYEVICAQLCGLGHYSMKGTLVVDTPADFESWLKERAELSGTQAPAPPTQRPPGEPPVGATPGTIPPPGAPKPQTAGEQPHPPAGAPQQPAAPASSPTPSQ
jgi:heme/copper-type cytochrome/quinol oxidase subunit 2